MISSGSAGLSGSSGSASSSGSAGSSGSASSYAPPRSFNPLPRSSKASPPKESPSKLEFLLRDSEFPPLSKSSAANPKPSAAKAWPVSLESTGWELRGGTATPEEQMVTSEEQIFDGFVDKVLKLHKGIVAKWTLSNLGPDYAGVYEQLIEKGILTSIDDNAGGLAISKDELDDKTNFLPSAQKNRILPILQRSLNIKYSVSVKFNNVVANSLIHFFNDTSKSCNKYVKYKFPSPGDRAKITFEARVEQKTFIAVLEALFKGEFLRSRKGVPAACFIKNNSVNGVGVYLELPHQKDRPSDRPPQSAIITNTSVRTRGRDLKSSCNNQADLHNRHRGQR